ncbi:hypothetical protein [Halosimplex halobium]|uniref:hypothetical protein n=1 Tax=Halosimplex halobium TaxID=3396618 RepID=UPI003F556C90
MADDGDARSEALAGARRVYDRQVATLENIDDKAMRTTRTAVLILGFIAGALTAAGPASVSDLSLVPAIIGSFGTVAVFGSAFVGVGIYTVTEYPVEIREGDLRSAGRAPRDAWLDGAIGRLDDASTSIQAEIEQNAEYLEVAQLLLIAGSLCLLYATAVTVVARSFGVSPTEQSAAFAAGVVLLTVAVWGRVKWRDGQPRDG